MCVRSLVLSLCLVHVFAVFALNYYCILAVAMPCQIIVVVVVVAVVVVVVSFCNPINDIQF